MPPPPQVWPGPSQAGQVTSWLQLLTLVPQPPPSQVSSSGSGTQARHSPLLSSQPKAQVVPPDQAPLVLQRCEASPLQRRVPGRHTPAQSPERHTKSQVSS